MARSLVAALTLLTLTVRPALAQADVPDAVALAAEEAGVNPVDLLGALNSTGLDARTYLCRVGELPCPKISAWPIDGPLGQRIYCVEFVESRHGQAMWNPVAMPGSGGQHAQGFLGWLPSTAARWGVRIGDRASEWSGAAAIFALGESFARTQFYGVFAGIC